MGVSALAVAGKALGDPTRVRVLMALRAGELCLCQIVDLFGLAPSTLSRHMAVLVAAGLVACRKHGRWRYFRLAAKDTADGAPQILQCVRQLSERDPLVARDALKLERIREKSLRERSACYRS